MDPWTLLCLDQKSSSFLHFDHLCCRLYASEGKGGEKRTNPSRWMYLRTDLGYSVLRTFNKRFQEGGGRAFTGRRRARRVAVFFFGSNMRRLWRFLKHRMTALEGAPGLLKSTYYV